jgi:DNA-binding NarL/FixJ family response regulator
MPVKELLVELRRGTNISETRPFFFKETLNNVRCHADAKSGDVEIDCSNGDLNLIEEDDGMGFHVGECTGFGPGLQNLKRRADLLLGTCEIASRPEGGTTVRFSVPLTAKFMGSMDQKIRVWLVEENDEFRNSVQRAVNHLEDMLCDGTFTSAEDAFEAMDAEIDPPEVILLDVQLPGIDGITVLGGFRDRAPEAKILILTVFDDTDKIFRAVCAGAAGYMLKSAGMDEIGGAIRQALGGGAPMTPKVARKVLDVFTNLEVESEEEPINSYGLTVGSRTSCASWQTV